MRYSVYRPSPRTCSPAAQTSRPVDKRIESYRRLLARSSPVADSHLQSPLSARSSLSCSSPSLLISLDAAPSCVTAGREWEEVSSGENTCDGEGASSIRAHLFLRPVLSNLTILMPRVHGAKGTSRFREHSFDLGHPERGALCLSDGELYDGNVRR